MTKKFHSMGEVFRHFFELKARAEHGATREERLSALGALAKSGSEAVFQDALNQWAFQKLSEKPHHNGRTLAAVLKDEWPSFIQSLPPEERKRRRKEGPPADDTLRKKFSNTLKLWKHLRARSKD